MSDNKNKFLNTIVKICKRIPIIRGFFAPHSRVSVVRLSGIIAETARGQSNISYAKLKRPLEKAFRKANSAVALIINSPGGSPAQSALVGDLIRQLAEENNLPVYAFIEDVAASGGYWLACAADEIYAQHVSIVGSIGVISAGFGFEDFIERYGVKRRVHTSGEEKSFLDPFKPENKDDVERLEALQKDIHASFIEWVKTRRGEKLSTPEKDLFEGQFWTANIAKELGIIDGLDNVRSFLRERFGKDVDLVDITVESRILPSLLPFGGKLNIGDDLADTLTARSLWARYGL